MNNDNLIRLNVNPHNGEIIADTAINNICMVNNSYTTCTENAKEVVAEHLITTNNKSYIYNKGDYHYIVSIEKIKRAKLTP